MYEERKYRSLFKGEKLVFFDVCHYETDLRIGAATDLSDKAMELVLKYRGELEAYIKRHPDFYSSLVPVSAAPGAPLIVREMCRSSAKAGVGPMAAVAGAFSELVGKGLLQYSAEVIVENGGDIFIKSSVKRKIGIYAGQSPLNEQVAIEIQPEKTPLGVCTSAGTVGHSLSFGKTDAAVIVSPDTFLADACATALGNLVKEPGDIENALGIVSGIDGVTGAMVIIGESMGAWGDITLVPF